MGGYLDTFVFVNKDIKKLPLKAEVFLCDSAGDRTLDPNIKSVVLYQLSY